MSFRAQGMRAWLLQRLSAIYIAAFTLSLMAWVISHYPVSYASWLSLFSHPAVLIASIIFYASVFVHAWVGVRDILVDYVNPSGIRFILLAVLAFCLIVMSLWLLIIVIGLVKL